MDEVGGNPVNRSPWGYRKKNTTGSTVCHFYSFHWKDSEGLSGQFRPVATGLN